MRSARRSISCAARRVNVSSRIRSGATPFSSRCATRCASVLVLPVPAPAMMSSGPAEKPATARRAVRGGVILSGIQALGERVDRRVSTWTCAFMGALSWPKTVYKNRRTMCARLTRERPTTMRSTQSCVSPAPRLLAGCTFAAGTLPKPAVSAIRAGHLVDVTNGQGRRRPGDPRARRSHRSGRRRRLPSRIPAGAKVIDLSAYTVLPGLIDTHTHITGDPTLPPYLRLRHVRAAHRAEGRGLRAADAARGHHDDSRRRRGRLQRRRRARRDQRRRHSRAAHPRVRSGARHHRRALRRQHARAGIQPLRRRRRRRRRRRAARSPPQRQVRRRRHQVLRHRRRVLQGRHARRAAVHVPGNAGADRRSAHGRPQGRGARARRERHQGRRSAPASTRSSTRA